ncbi:hypothetical protein V8E52_006322 [Russula decolorans]
MACAFLHSLLQFPILLFLKVSEQPSPGTQTSLFQARPRGRPPRLLLLQSLCGPTTRRLRYALTELEKHPKLPRHLSFSSIPSPFGPPLRQPLSMINLYVLRLIQVLPPAHYAILRRPFPSLILWKATSSRIPSHYLRDQTSVEPPASSPDLLLPSLLSSSLTPRRHLSYFHSFLGVRRHQSPLRPYSPLQFSLITSRTHLDHRPHPRKQPTLACLLRLLPPWRPRLCRTLERLVRTTVPRTQTLLY